MTIIKVLSLKDKAEWKKYLEILPLSEQDIYFTPEYYDIYEKNGDGIAYCFVLIHDNNIALYPFLINRINNLGYKLDKEYYDIQGAYGYNGVLASTRSQDFKKLFYEEFSKYCSYSNIVAEFTRFHPLIKNCIWSSDYLDVIFNRNTVYIDLTLGYKELYRNYKKDVKENIRTAIKNNLIVKVYKNEYPYKSDFIQYYKENMKSFQARDYLHYGEIFFDNIFKNLPLVQFVVMKENIMIASIMCIYHGLFIHAHLSATNREYLSFRPINLLFDKMIQYGIENGFKILHLGGGRTSDENDSLLTFKRKHSNVLSDFYIGTKLYNKEIYKDICEQWAAQYPHLINKYSNTILKYRYSI